jgi:hypothetical protein
MKTIIAGSRDLTDIGLLHQAIKESGFEITEVVCGGATGMDELGRQYALENNIDLTVCHANWKGKGKAAGFLRNTRMAEYAEALICVHHETAGSQDMIRQAKEKFLMVYEKVVAAPPPKVEIEKDTAETFADIIKMAPPIFRRKTNSELYNEWKNERYKNEHYKDKYINNYKNKIIYSDKSSPDDF